MEVARKKWTIFSDHFWQHQYNPTTSKIMQKLPLKQYAALLCETIGRYDFPPVTYDFAKNEEIRHSGMRAVEKDIHDLLCSGDTQKVKDGLSNVLYWGHANNKFLQTSSLNNFRGAPDAELKRKLDRFGRLARELAGSSIVPSAGSLLKIKELGIPQFGRVSFASKILMFLDPARYPVLDTMIANKVVNLCFSLCFPPLQGLKFESIKISPDSARAYDTWACWCREIARVVNNTPESPCLDVRAVDVERALFALADLKNIDEAKKAHALLAGPEGWTFKRCSA